MTGLKTSTLKSSLIKCFYDVSGLLMRHYIRKEGDYTKEILKRERQHSYFLGKLTEKLEANEEAK